HSPIGDPGRDDERAATYFAAVPQFDKPGRAVHAYTRHFLRGENLRTEPPRLRDRTASQVESAQAGRKAEIVFNSGTPARLPSRSLGVDKEGWEAVGCAIDGRSQTGRSGTDDYQIIKRQFRLRPQSQFFRHHSRSRIMEIRAVCKHNQGQLLAGR